MFGLFRPRQPLDTREKAWIERRLRWLAAEFGAEVLRGGEQVRPGRFPLPAGYRGSEEEVRRVADWVCPRLGVAAETVELRIVPDVEIPGAGGTWQPAEAGSLIRIAESTCHDPLALVTVVAHELAHARLIGEGRIAGDEPDHELLTDLLSAALGFGVFAANATITERYEQSGNWHRWQIGRRGYLTAREIGYALAVLCWVRGDRSTDWAGDLRLDARETFRGGLKYLDRTGDSLFRSETAGRPVASRAASAAVADLGGGTPTVRIAAVWEVESAGAADATILRALIDRTRDHDRDVRAAAATALGTLAPEDVAVQDELYHLLGDGEIPVRVAAANALALAASLPPERAGEVDGLLGSGQPILWDAAARVLGRMGPAVEGRAARLVGPLVDALIDCRAESAETLVWGIAMITRDPEGFLRERVGERDEELGDRAVAVLRELRGEVPVFGSAEDDKFDPDDSGPAPY